MAKYRKKPVVVEAEVYKPGLEDGFDERPFHHPDFAFNPEERTRETAKRFGFWVEQIGTDIVKRPYINTLEGKHYISPGDYIITGVKGERYPCKSDIFEMTYEEASESKGAVCRGCWSLGTACGRCERCKENHPSKTIQQLQTQLKALTKERDEYQEQVRVWANKQVELLEDRIQVLWQENQRLREALELVADDVCSLNCPSVWKTAEGRPPCSAKCQAVKEALQAQPCEPKPTSLEQAVIDAAVVFIEDSPGPDVGCFYSTTCDWEDREKDRCPYCCLMDTVQALQKAKEQTL